MNGFLVFADGPITGNVVQPTYDTALVVLSYLVAAYAAYTALDFAGRVRQSARVRGVALAWLAGGAVAMGAGIWGMHFIGMLAWRLPLHVGYDLGVTLASLLVAILLSGFALALVSRRTLPLPRLASGGILMGLGVVVMHYTGMAAIRMEALIVYSPVWFGLSVLNAIVCSTVAIWLVFRLGAADGSRWQSLLKVVAALFMGLAIAGMHYTAMYAGICTATEPVGDEFAPVDPRLERLVMAGVALLIGSVVLAVWVQNQIVSSRQRLSERRLALVMDNVPAMIAYVDAGARYSFVNKAYAQWLGADCAQIIGRKVSALRTAAGEAIGHLGGLTAAGMQDLWEGKRVRYEMATPSADGKTAYADIELLPEPNEHGGFAYYVLATDVTHRKAGEEQMRAAKEAAERADRTKSQFLASMSHEIRTPMNGVLGMAELLLGTQLDARQRKFAQAIHRSGNALLGIINDILDFSKIEAGRLELDSCSFDLQELCDDIVGLLGEQAAAKRVSLDCDIDPTLPRTVIGDPLRVRQILTNLVGNAVKFTDRGAVRVVVERAPPELLQSPSTDADCAVRVRVIDSGIGMDDETMGRLFTAFSQADAATTRHYGGTGLGLAISKQLAQLMGGNIGASSRLGQGSTFWFTVRLGIGRAPKVDDAAAGATAHARGLHAARVLLAEDNAVNREIGLAMLEALGCTVDCVADGRAVLTAVAARRYDVVLMDCQMPELDGFDATRALREAEACAAPDAMRSARRLPIVALTANAMQGDRERCLHAGMDDYLTKPFNKEQLRALLERWIPPAAAALRAA